MKSKLGKIDLFESRPVWEAIFALALPSVVGQIILVIYNMADTLYVGMTGSDAMITSVTVCMPAFMFLSAISNLFGVGGASVISRAMGKGDRERAVRASRFAVWGCLAVGALYVIGVFLTIDPFLDLLGGSAADVHGNARAYMITAVVIGGLPTTMSTLFSHLLRAEGHSFEASLGIALGGVLNIGLDPLFMFAILPAGNEALGAAIATCVSNVVSLLYFLVIFAAERKVLIFSARPSVSMFGAGVPHDVIYTGIPACLMTLCENISYAVLDNLMVAYGTAAQAGIGVAKKVNMLAHSVVRGMTQGVLPLIGYNYASGNRKRMKSVLYCSGGLSVFISLCCMAVSLIFSRDLIAVFIQGGTDSVTDGAEFLQILCIGAPFSACAYTVISFFQATGKGIRSLTLALLRKGILDIPLMFALNVGFSKYGIVWATPIADMLCCVAAIVLFIAFIRRHGKDKSVA